ncbi:MAG TPA: hypothetical protein VK949_07960 [Methylotenera sp.]|nr:hypothetical protein [Methylotenera sp.]
MNTATLNARNASTVALTVSGFFKQISQVDNVLFKCLKLGIPRDLIDIAVSEKAATKFNQLKAKRNTDNWFAWTGRGALLGLLTSITLTLGLILLEGYDISNQLALIQLLGPDIGVIVGAFIGALYGWLKESDNNVLMQRAEQREDALLMLVYRQSPDMAEKIQQIFREQNAEAIEVENVA